MSQSQGDTSSNNLGTETLPHRCALSCLFFKKKKKEKKSTTEKTQTLMNIKNLYIVKIKQKKTKKKKTKQNKTPYPKQTYNKHHHSLALKSESLQGEKKEPWVGDRAMLAAWRVRAAAGCGKSVPCSCFL